MSLASNICRRAGSSNYYARLGVPIELRKACGGTIRTRPWV